MSHTWYHQLYTSEDYWAVWTGLLFLVVAIVVTSVHNGDLQGPVPATWTSLQDAFSVQSFVFYLAMVAIATLVTAVSRRAIKRAKAAPGGAKADADVPFWPIVRGFLLLSAIAFFAQLVGNIKALKSVGLSNEFWALLFGLILSNLVPCMNASLPACITKEHACHSSIYINIGLVLLALDIQTLLSLGPRAFFVSWIGTPVVFLCSLWMSRHWLNFPQCDDMAAMMSAGLSICGNSAASALHSAIKGNETELSIVLSILTLAATVQIFIVPFLAILMHISKPVGAAWIGAAVDSTGAVLASAALLDSSQEIINIASTVKMVQNILISVIAVSVSVYWAQHKREGESTPIVAGRTSVQADSASASAGVDEQGPASPSSSATAYVEVPAEQDEDKDSSLSSGILSSSKYGSLDSRHNLVSRLDVLGADIVAAGVAIGVNIGNNSSGGSAVPQATHTKTESDVAASFKWIDLWTRFPKFVLGFLVVSITLSIFSSVAHHQEEQIRNITSAASTFWFTVGFVCIGLEAQVAAIRDKLKGKGGVWPLIKLYTLGQVLDLVFRFLLAQIAFGWL